MKELIEYIAKHLVDYPEKVVVEESKSDDNTIVLTLQVEKNDMGKVIGKQGKHAIAMRLLLSAVGAKANCKASLQILDKNKD